MFNPASSQALKVPPGGSASRQGGQPWENCGVAGFSVQALLEDEAAGLRTWLMKIEPGATAPLHAHEEIEQVFLVEGSFDDGEKTYAAGDYIVRAPGALHLTASAQGATMLVIYSSAGANS